MTDRRRRVLLAVVLAVATLTAGIGLLAASVPPAEVDAATGASPPTTDPGAVVEPIHAAGITGENVSVGVVDVTGFDTDARPLAGRVAGTRSFGAGDLANAGRNGHGTAAASLVATTAPDADLYLANFDRASGYRRAMAWLLERDVDVVVAPVSFYGRPGDGSADVTRIADRAAREGTVVVAPVGNLGQGHWSGAYDEARDGKLRFAGGTRNYLRSEDGRDLSLWLSWERGVAENYTAELYWTNGSATQLIARSRPYRGASATEHLSVRLAGGSYFVVVRGPDRPTGTELELVSPTHRFQYRDPAGSIAAPATGREVLSVGAYDVRRERPAAYSSRGPTADGRTGVDVVAPARLQATDRSVGFVGSSAAAPYVAGVAALVLDADPERSAAAVRETVRASATDVGDPGVDTATGRGLVRPRDAVELTGNAS